MAKQKTTQQFIFKINSTLLAKNHWDLELPLERARKVPGLVVSLADSQILTWINQLNGTTDYDSKAKAIKRDIKFLKKFKQNGRTLVPRFLFLINFFSFTCLWCLQFLF